MTSEEEEEGPVVATSTAATAAPSAAAISRARAAIARGDGNDAVAHSSPRGPSIFNLPRSKEKEEKEEEEIEEEGIIQEERIEEEEEEDMVECDGGGDDDGSSDTSVLVVPYPELVPVVFFCLKQTTCPRSLCIRMVSSPYPFTAVVVVVVGGLGGAFVMQTAEAKASAWPGTKFPSPWGVDI
ncbi:voltage-dependent T-type calcium channel subunit alpha-1H [Antennarius striatus]|uniref:voltage-dependent T-type calcium channel subunit alpha-1H n=1 Tax=Antennarius striatus TaxID=241820 RepID=UPI0035B1F8D9